MGTRHLTMVISNKQTKVAQYGQWDGYPSGQGLNILKFLHGADLKEFQKKLEPIRFITDKDREEVDAFLKSIGCENGWMDIEQSKKYQEKYFFISRDCGSDILRLIMGESVSKYDYEKKEDVEIKQEVRFLADNSEFAADSLFCEWAYVIDLDKGTFEVYKGFNQKPLGKTQRFYYLRKQKHEKGYYPVRLAKKYKLNELPTEDKFVEELKRKEED